MTRDGREVPKSDRNGWLNFHETVDARCPDAAASLKSPNCTNRPSASCTSRGTTKTLGSAGMRHVVLTDGRRDLGGSPVTAAQTIRCAAVLSQRYFPSPPQGPFPPPVGRHRVEQGISWLLGLPSRSAPLILAGETGGRLFPSWPPALKPAAALARVRLRAMEFWQATPRIALPGLPGPNTDFVKE